MSAPTVPVACKCGHPRAGHRDSWERPNAGWHECSSCSCAKYIPDWPTRPANTLFRFRAEIYVEAPNAEQADALALRLCRRVADADVAVKHIERTIPVPSSTPPE